MVAGGQAHTWSTAWGASQLALTLALGVVPLWLSGCTGGGDDMKTETTTAPTGAQTGVTTSMYTTPGFLDTTTTTRDTRDTRSSSDSWPRSPQLDAEFLMQASFGPTQATLSELRELGSYSEWIRAQIQMPGSLHREYYRKRVNPRLESSLQPGAPRSRCSPGSRWRRSALSPSDVGKHVRVQRNTIYVDGSMRSIIDPNFVGNDLREPVSCTNIGSPNMQRNGKACSSSSAQRNRCLSNNWQADKICQQSCYDNGYGYEGDDCSPGWRGFELPDGVICNVQDTVGGVVALAAGSSCSSNQQIMPNPGVWFDSGRADKYTETLWQFDTLQLNVILLASQQLPRSCELKEFIKTGGKFYHFDSRLELIQNTVEAPAGTSAGSCPSVPKSFLNAAGCKLMPSCTPLTVQDGTIKLDRSTLERFYSQASMYVYAITGLRTSSSPCNRVSRWARLDCGKVSCIETSGLDATGKQRFAEALKAARGWPTREVDVDCSGIPAHAVLTATNGDTYRHVHPQEYNVYDFTQWVLAHKGGETQITKWATGPFVIEFPAGHSMSRWNAGTTQRTINYVGLYHEDVNFQDLPSSMQTVLVSSVFGGGESDTGYYQACGSPGEVSNAPAEGHHLAFFNKDADSPDARINDDVYDRAYEQVPETGTAKVSVWVMLALEAQDQLRQRMAWALSQILVVAKDGIAGADGRLTEQWVNYYDIFVRNAFGSYRDILREVTYSPLMGEYLTYRGSKAYDVGKNYPDENYAREIMQLFTIGLDKLNPDGTQVLDGNGNTIPTYSNDNIMDFARVFTGFDRQLPRGNIESSKNGNKVDPMKMVASRHDVYPKPDLDGNYLGDRYPLCDDLPKRSYLAKGARFEFLGHKLKGENEQLVLVLDPGSMLYRYLCNQNGGNCAFVLNLELDNDLQCQGVECSTANSRYFKVDAGYYEYVPPACVHLFFFNGRITSTGKPKQFAWSSRKICKDPSTPVAGASCCVGCKDEISTGMTERGRSCENAEEVWPRMFTDYCNNNDGWTTGAQWCAYTCYQKGVGYPGMVCDERWREARICGIRNEYVPYDVARERCRDEGMDVCHTETAIGNCGYNDGDFTRIWTPETCQVDVEIDADGKVSLQVGGAKQNKFAVNWINGYPDPDACPSGCTANGVIKTCTCSASVAATKVFNRAPTASALQAKLFIGAFPPTTACDVCSGEVLVYGAGNGYNENTVFEYQGRFYKNVESIVTVGGKAFRNPPAFMLRDFPTTAAALAEVESLLDHLFYHPNTAPFVAYRLIQRLVTSNPSPPYVRAVAEAFRTGAYAGTTYSGSYGDLSATAAAILLHREARDARSTQVHGKLREPLVKAMHFFRAMGYVDSEDRELVLLGLHERIGMEPYNSPTVFNFYRPGYKPPGLGANLVAPEFQIFTAPMAVSFVNVLAAVIDRGLCSSDGSIGHLPCSRGTHGSFSFQESATVDETLAKLDLLLTGGRINKSPSAKRVVRDAYLSAAEGEGLKAAQKAVVMSPEFNALGDPLVIRERPSESPDSESPASSYKAMIMFFMQGGADTFNLLVPMECGLYDEYRTVRQNVALETFELNQINTVGQACTKFGIHANMPFLKELYDQEKVAFVSNVGNLLHPVTKEQYKKGGVPVCVGLFSHSDMQDSSQSLKCQEPGGAPGGQGGRLADALGAAGFKTTSFSLAGTTTWAQGFQTNIETISPSKGAVRLLNFDSMGPLLGNITSQEHGNVYCEHYAKKIQQSARDNERLGKYLEKVELATNYPESSSKSAQQLRQVAKLIATRQERKAERDLFFVSLGGFDSHSNVDEILRNLYKSMDDALRDFVAELKAQNVFDQTVLFTSSDFGRTLTSNGLGTDHAWAGNYFVLGGAINGGRVLNDFPSSLLEGNSQDAGRGRMIPKYPWESFLAPISQWMGLMPPAQSSVFPNIANFNRSEHILDINTLFRR